MSFNQFYVSWMETMRELVNQLTKAPRPPTNDDETRFAQDIVDRTMTHYTEYYRAKAAFSFEQDACRLFSSPWNTSLERSLQWITDWRPTIIFHLIYTESSIMFESHILEILRGIRTGDLGDLSPSQFRRVSELQCETVDEENVINDELAEWQDNATLIVTNAETAHDIYEHVEQIKMIVNKADDLRLLTIRSIVELLTTRQAVEFLIAASELQFGIGMWGHHVDYPRAAA